MTADISRKRKTSLYYSNRKRDRSEREYEYFVRDRKEMSIAVKINLTVNDP